MGLTRRKFLGGLGAGALWGVTGLAGAGLAARAGLALARGGPPELDLATVTAATFRPHVGTRFGIRDGGGREGVLELAAVEDAPPDGATDSFALVFTLADGPVPRQAVHRLEHKALGSFGLFVVAGGDSVVAVINHLAA